MTFEDKMENYFLGMLKQGHRCEDAIKYTRNWITPMQSYPDIEERIGKIDKKEQTKRVEKKLDELYSKFCK